MKKITLTHDMRNADGSDWTSAQFAGFEIAFDGKPAVALPAQWAARNAQTGVTTFEFDPIARGFTLPEGQHTAQAWAVDKDGDRSAPTAVLTFVEKVVPSAPKSLAVS